MSSEFELLTAVLILVYSTENGNDLLVCRKRNRTGNSCTAALSCINNLCCCRIYYSMVITLDLDSDFSLTAT